MRRSCLTPTLLLPFIHAHQVVGRRAGGAGWAAQGASLSEGDFFRKAAGSRHCDVLSLNSSALFIATNSWTARLLLRAAPLCGTHLGALRETRGGAKI